MIIDGNLEVTIGIDGQEIPVPSKEILILANQNVNVALPSIVINIVDAANVLDKDVPLNDGSILDVKLGDGSNPAKSIRYRVFGTPPRRPGSGGLINYVIHGILDAIPYIRANPGRGKFGPSSLVMEQIATAMDFQFVNNTKTNDSMMWLPGRKTWNGFAEHLAAHGWVNETSAMHIGVTEKRELHFHDINKLFADGQIKKYFYYGSKPINPQSEIQAVDEYSAENHSGILNNTFGYGLRLAQSSVVTGDVKKFANVKAMTVNNLIDMNKTVLNQVGSRGRIDIPQINTGNTYESYMQARHQNSRLRAIYSQNVYILVSKSSGINLFDMVQFSSNDATGSDDSVGGLYCVTNISTVVGNRKYKEKIQLTSAGPQNGSNFLV